MVKSGLGNFEMDRIVNMNIVLSRYSPGSKTPTSKFSERKEVRWGDEQNPH